MSSDPLWKRLRAVNWQDHGISTEQGKELAKVLQDLAGKKEARAMKASQKLWSFIRANSSSAEALRPFLEEIRHISEPAIRDEIHELLELG